MNRVHNNSNGKNKRTSIYHSSSSSNYNSSSNSSKVNLNKLVNLGYLGNPMGVLDNPSPQCKVSSN